MRIRATGIAAGARGLVSVLVLTILLALASTGHPAVGEGAAGQAAQAVLRSGPTIDAGLPRYGVNLGSWTTWGAEQLSAHIVKNPGLQPGIDRSLVVVARIDGKTFVDDAPWAARPDGFWQGARYAVLAGAARGMTGVVSAPPAPETAPAASGVAARPAAETRAPLALSPWPAGLARGDVVALTRDDPDTLPMWWLTGDVRALAGAGPSGGPAARVDGTHGVAALRQYFDMLGPRAGKLLPLDGRWRLSLRVRAAQGAPRIALRFGRDRAPALVDRTLAPRAEWQAVRIDFDARDPGPAGPVTLSIEVADGAALFSDIDVEDLDAGPGGFRGPVVDTLRTLRPGYLRDWQGQLADGAGDRFGERFDRHPTRYRAGDAEWQYGYDAGAVFALSAAVGARPWLVVPTTFDDRDATAFGRRIAEFARRDGIDETVVEFGNENWNALFRPAGIMDAATLAARADRVFALIRAAAGRTVLHCVVGGQYANPGGVAQLASASRGADGIAVAPYFLYRMDAGERLDMALDDALTADADGPARLAAGLRGTGKALDVYEVNFHTTLGDAPASARAAVLASPSAGAALAARLISATLAGSRRQAVYSLAGFDTLLSAPRVPDNDALVPLWGIARDLAVPDQLRPTGVALAMLNEIAGGTVRAPVCSGAGCGALLAVSFDDARYALVSKAATPIQVELPCGGHSAFWVARLGERGSEPNRGGEQSACDGKRAFVTVQPRGLTTARGVDP